MEFVKLTPENLETEHICCAIPNNRDLQVASKKAWLQDRLDEGLVFLKSAERGKCFIEYLPAEAAWAPIEAGGYMHVNCFWVSGSLKGHGYANDLLATCAPRPETYTDTRTLQSKASQPQIRAGPLPQEYQ